MRSAAWAEDVLRGEVPRWRAIGATATQFLDCCRTLEIGALVYDRLTRIGVPDDWPPCVVQDLEREARSAAACELVRSREVTDVLGALAACGVQVLLLKGAALAHTVYESPAMRPRVDTDLLIGREEVTASRNAFARLGYIEPLLTDGELVFCQFQMLKIDALGIAHVFDVHWKISTQAMFAEVLSGDELQRDAVSIPTLGAHARTVSARQSLLLACIHPVMHHRNAQRLIWIYDVDRLVRCLTQKELLQFARMAVRKQLAAICAAQLRIAVERLHTPVPPAVIHLLEARPAPEPAAVYLCANRRWHHELISNLRALGAWDRRLRLLREVLFPSPGYMLNAYHLGARGAVLLPALYLHRCAHGVLKVLSGRK